MRILQSGVCALAIVGLCVGVSANGNSKLVIMSAEVSATGTIVFISGANFGRTPGVSLGGTPLGGVTVNRAGTQLTAIMPAVPPGSYLLQVWRGYEGHERAKFSLAVGAMGPKGDTGSKGDKGDNGEPGSPGAAGAPGAKGDKGDSGTPGAPGTPAAPGTPGNLALAGLMCPQGQMLRGFSPTGALVCASTSTCGDGTLQTGEEFEPAPGPFSTAPVSATSCKFDFSQAPQLYCSGSCSIAGPPGCDQADADMLCKLKTGNPNSVASSFDIGLPLDAPGFACPYPGLGTLLPSMAARGVNVNVYYNDTSILLSHGGGDAVTNVVCTTP